MNTFKAELLENGVVIKTFEEKTNTDYSNWVCRVAIPTLKPRCREVRFYINGKIQLGNW